MASGENNIDTAALSDARYIKVDVRGEERFYLHTFVSLAWMQRVPQRTTTEVEVAEVGVTAAEVGVLEAEVGVAEAEAEAEGGQDVGVIEVEAEVANTQKHQHLPMMVPGTLQ